MRGHPCGGNPEDDSSDYRNSQREEQDRSRGRGVHRDPGGRSGDGKVKDEAGASVRYGDARSGTEHTEREALRQRLAYEPPARRAESSADRRLAPVLQTAREQQIGDVGASYE